MCATLLRANSIAPSAPAGSNCSQSEIDRASSLLMTECDVAPKSIHERLEAQRTGTPSGRSLR